jgi:hypothetical protein
MGRSAALTRHGTTSSYGTMISTSGRVLQHGCWFHWFGCQTTKHEKNREMGEAKAFCGRRLIEQCNNQPSVGVIGGRFPIEEVRPGWSAWLGVIPSFGLMMRQKKWKQLFHCGLRWPPVYYYIHNNQPNTCGKGEWGNGKEVGPGGSAGATQYHRLGGDSNRNNRNN